MSPLIVAVATLAVYESSAYIAGALILSPTSLLLGSEFDMRMPDKNGVKDSKYIKLHHRLL